jgi:hypothetical protein
LALLSLGDPNLGPGPTALPWACLAVALPLASSLALQFWLWLWLWLWLSAPHGPVVSGSLFPVSRLPSSSVSSSCFQFPSQTSQDTNSMCPHRRCLRPASRLSHLLLRSPANESGTTPQSMPRSSLAPYDMRLGLQGPPIYVRHRQSNHQHMAGFPHRLGCIQIWFAVLPVLPVFARHKLAISTRRRCRRRVACSNHTVKPHSFLILHPAHWCPAPPGKSGLKTSVALGQIASVFIVSPVAAQTPLSPSCRVDSPMAMPLCEACKYTHLLPLGALISSHPRLQHFS